MNPRIFEITLSGFSFPDSEDLKDNQANFRFLVDLRFVDANGEPRVVHTIMPSAANFWECDTDEKDKPNFVRKQDGQDANGNPKFLPKFDMDKIEDWDKMIFWIRGCCLKTIRFRVYDVNREDWWNKFAEVLKAIPGVFAGFLGPVAGVAKEASSTLIDKTFRNSKLLFQGVQDLDSPQEDPKVAGKGKEKGDYEINFTIVDSTPCPSSS